MAGVLPWGWEGVDRRAGPRVPAARAQGGGYNRRSAKEKGQVRRDDRMFSRDASFRAERGGAAALRSKTRVAAKRSDRGMVTLSPCHLVTLSLGGLLLTAGPAHAHGLSAVGKLKGDTVVIEVFFTDNMPARDAKVSVRDSLGNE